jgi:hypothetical protein
VPSAEQADDALDSTGGGMSGHIRWVIAAFTLGVITACVSSSDEVGSPERACAPETFACEGRTPGFWSNNNGCALLPALYADLNAYRAAAGLPPVDTCAEVQEVLLVDAEEMEDKLVAMWTAFTLNQLDFFEGDCYGEDIFFEWTWYLWPPGSASQECKDAVEGWFEGRDATFAELNDLAILLITSPDATPCEQEALKDFFDAVNNRDALCLCDCPSEPTGGEGGGGPTGAL